MHNRPPGLGWPENVAAGGEQASANIQQRVAAQHDRRLVGWYATQQQQQRPPPPPPPAVPPPPPPPPPPVLLPHHMRADAQRRALLEGGAQRRAMEEAAAQQAIARAAAAHQQQIIAQAAAQQQPLPQHPMVINIDSGDSEEIEATADFRPPIGNRRRKSGGDGGPEKKRAKQPNRSAPIIPEASGRPREPQFSGSLAGEFVTGVDSRRLFELEKESNRKVAISNIIMTATGWSKEATENPPRQMTLSIGQVQMLANRIVDDRNDAVRAAVRFASEEMQSKHDKLMMREMAKFESEKTRRLRAEAQLEASQARNYRLENDKAGSYRQLSAEMVQLKENLKKQSQEKLKEIASLKMQLAKERSKAKDVPNATELEEENAALKEKLKYLQERQARSISSLMQSSVHSLRLLQGKRNGN